MVELIKNLKFFIFLLISISLFFYLIANFLNSIFTIPITNNDKYIIIKKNINETAFLNYLNRNKVKISKLQWYVSKFFTKDKFVLKHGEFLISKSYSLIDLLDKINNNEIYYRKFTLIEGTNSKQLKNKLIIAPGLKGEVPYLSKGKFKPEFIITIKLNETKLEIINPALSKK